MKPYSKMNGEKYTQQESLEIDHDKLDAVKLKLAFNPNCVVRERYEAREKEIIQDIKDRINFIANNTNK